VIHSENYCGRTVVLKAGVLVYKKNGFNCVLVKDTRTIKSKQKSGPDNVLRNRECF
jgi:hypothetical protein